MGSRILHVLPHLISAHIFRIPLPPRPDSAFEANNRDDDTAYGAPGISDTYFGNIHEVHSDKVSDALKGPGPNTRQLSEESDTTYAEPPAQETSTTIDDDDDDYAHHIPNSSQPPTHNPFAAPPDNTHDAEVHLIECYHELAHGTSCHQCTAAMRRRCFERVTAVINAARSIFKHVRKPEHVLEETLPLTVEPFDEYTRELVVRLPPRLSNYADARTRRSHGTVLVLRFVLFNCTRGGCGGVQVLLIIGWRGRVGREFGAIYLGR